MPELPEVETVRRGLLPAMEGGIVARLDVNRAGLRWTFPDGMKKRIEGQKVLTLRRRSKYILADFSGGETLIIHLGMSGRMTVSGVKIGVFHHDHPAPQKHDHVVFHMQDGARVTFNDPRRFGAMDLTLTADCDRHKILANLGPEPFSNSFTEPYLQKALIGRKTAIKTMLLDQRLVAGLGNIYVCETLFRAQISPLCSAGDLTNAQSAALIPLIRQVLEEAIEAGGSSLKDHRQADGALGYFQHSFQVYGREGEGCAAAECDGKVERAVQAGRSSFYCPKCQK